MSAPQPTPSNPQQGSGQAPVRPSLQDQPPVPARPIRTTYLLTRPPRNSNPFSSNPFSRRLRLQIQQYSDPEPRGNPTPPITTSTSNPTASSSSGPSTRATTAFSSSNTTATASSSALTTPSTAANSAISPNIPTNSPSAPVLRPTPIYNLASPPLPRSRHKLKIAIPDSGDTVAVSRPDKTTDRLRTSLMHPRRLLEFAPTLQLGLGQRWVATWCSSRWVWIRAGGPGQAIWRKTGDLHWGQAVWVLEVFAISSDASPGSGADLSAADPVGVRVAGKAGSEVWIENGAGVGVLDGVSEDGLVMLALLTAALVQLM